MFDNFVAACKINNKVAWIDDVLDDARKDFGILSFDQLLKFIVNGGLEKVKPQKPKPWEKNKNPKLIIIAYGYEFHTGCKCGYIAFFYQPVTKKWVIKSFHISKYFDNSFGDLLTKAIAPKQKELENDNEKNK